ncbi:hypothetical protein HDE_03093 [Halotydeus destructor]|nr:hypothetical protein HDE_03093 [Halotydeus destructor]
MRFILQGTETKLSANGRLYLLMAIYNISVSDEGFALLSKQTGWAAILCLTLRNEDYCTRIKALCVKVLASFCLSSERRILQEVSGNLSTEYLRSLSRMPEMEEDVNHLSDLLYG